MLTRLPFLLLAAGALACAQEYKIAVVGLVHSHVWGHLERMIKGETPARLAGIAEPNAELVTEAKRMGAAVPFFADYKAMLDQVRPDIVWAFVENNRHLEIVQACAPRKIHIMFEKPLASSHRDALAIQQLAGRHGIQVMTNYQMVWWPSNYAVRQQADAGAVGQVWRLRGVVGHGGPGSSGVRSKYFFAWLTDPVQNGGGALVDFGCYNALWALWYLGRPQTVYAQVNHLRPETFPKVEDNATLVLHYKNGVGLFEGSWDLPRSFQDLEVFGLGGSLYMTRDRVELRKSRSSAPESLPLAALAPERAEPVAYMVHCLRTKQPLEGLVAPDINVAVTEILDAAKESAQKSVAVRLR